MLMKKWTALFVVVILYSCQTVKIGEATYQTTPDKVELGVVGQATTFIINKDFTAKAYPDLQSKIRVDVRIVPFTKKINKVYEAQKVNNQNLSTVHYIDSLPVKPELVTLSILDSNGFCTELNSLENQAVNKYLRNTKKGKVITAIAVLLKEDDIQKLKNADAFYLYNKQHKKYTLLLYKEGKQIDVIDMHAAPVLGYQLSKFCWIEERAGKWQIADIVKDCESCQGNTVKYITEKKETKNLFKM